MIKIKLLAGEFAGRERIIPPEVKPMDLLLSCLAHGDRWQVDYSQATPEEILAWMGADITCRSLRALRHGRVVLFLGQPFCLQNLEDPEELMSVAQQIEDMIVQSGKMVSIGRDDEHIFEIVAAGDEPTYH